MRTNADDFFDNLFRTDNTQFTDMLDMLMIVDIGRVLDIDEYNRATIQSYKVIGGTPVVFKDVEVVGIGNNYGCLSVNCIGSTCLILIPRTNVPDIRNQKINLASLPFSKDGIKAIPISNGNDVNARINITDTGSVTVTTKDYVWEFGINNVSLVTEEGLTFQVDADSTYLLYRYTENSGKFWNKISDEGYELRYETRDKSSRFNLTLNEEGTCTLLHTIPDKADATQPGTLLNKLSIDKAGVITIKGKEEKTTLTLNLDGSISLTTEQDITLEAGNISLTANSVNINDGHLEVT